MDYSAEHCEMWADVFADDTDDDQKAQAYRIAIALLQAFEVPFPLVTDTPGAIMKA
jgi:hypothetical protein